MVEIRIATGDDNQDLIEIQQKCPQGTDMVINIDRSPDFFARTTPYENSTCFVAEVGGNIAGAAQCAFRELNFGGEQVKAVYEMGYIVDPSYRRRGIASQLHEAIEEYSREKDADLAHLNIVESNTPSTRLFEKHEFINWGKNLETVIIPQKRQKIEKLDNIRPLTENDLPEITQMMNKNYIQYDFYETMTPDSLLGYIERMPGFNIEDIMVYDEEGIKACLGCWDYETVLKIIVIKLNTKLSLLSGTVNFLGKFMDMPKMPRLGESMKQYFLTHSAYTDQEALRELVKHAMNRTLDNKMDNLIISLDPKCPHNKVFQQGFYSGVKSMNYVKPLHELDLSMKGQNLLYMDMIDI